MQIELDPEREAARLALIRTLEPLEIRCKSRLGTPIVPGEDGALHLRDGDVSEYQPSDVTPTHLADALEAALDYGECWGTVIAPAVRLIIARADEWTDWLAFTQPDHAATIRTRLRETPEVTEWPEYLRRVAAMVGKPVKEDAPTPKMKEPKAIAFAAYRASVATGAKQAALAQMLNDSYEGSDKPPDGVIQGHVSKWLTEVREWIAAGNVLPDLPARKPTPRTVTVDPARLDKGRRTDGRRGR